MLSSAQTIEDKTNNNLICKCISTHQFGFRTKYSRLLWAIRKSYIHNWPLKPSVRITASLLTPLMLWVLILYVSIRTYSFKSTPNNRFFRNLFMIILFTLRVFARNLLRGSRRRNIFFLYFIFDARPRIRTRALRLIRLLTEVAVV